MNDEVFSKLNPKQQDACRLIAACGGVIVYAGGWMAGEHAIHSATVRALRVRGVFSGDKDGARKLVLRARVRRSIPMDE